MASKAEAKISTDHDEIREWAEARGGEPACVKGTGDPGDIGMIRIDFPGFSGEDSLQHITWDEWFGKFDERGLALLHQETTAGGAQSNFNKLVSRETAEASNAGRGKNTGKKAAGKKAEAKKAPAKKTAGKKEAAKGAKKGAGKKVEAKKAAGKKAAGKKAPAKKAVKKVAAKKTAGKKAAAKKGAAKKAAGRGRGR